MSIFWEALKEYLEFATEIDAMTTEVGLQARTLNARTSSPFEVSLRLAGELEGVNLPKWQSISVPNVTFMAPDCLYSQTTKLGFHSVRRNASQKVPGKLDYTGGA